MRYRDWLFETLSIGNVHNSMSGRSCDGRRSMWGFQVQAAANIPSESLHICRTSCSTCAALIVIPIWLRRSGYWNQSSMKAVLCYLRGDIPSPRFAIAEALIFRNTQLLGLLDVTRANSVVTTWVRYSMLEHTTITIGIKLMSLYP